MNLFHLSLTSALTLGVADIVAGALCLAMILRPRRRRGRWFRHVTIAILAGAAAGGTAIWVVGDVMNAFDVPPTWVDRAWVSAMVAGVCLAIVNLVYGPAGRKVAAAVGVIAVVVAGGLALNRDVGEFPRLGDALGVTGSEPLILPHPRTPGTAAADDDLYADWKAPELMPRRGRVGSVTIPATKSHFDARKALVYLPPAALVASAPALPVVVLMSGQPGSPLSVMTAGRVPQILNALARRDHGLAPIVVVPDQLGSAGANPMCVDGPLGNSATYLTEDVPDWITTHLHVQTGPTAWVVGGFSQGATCALQFATALPELFGSLIDVSGQQYPTLSSDDRAIDQGFGGSTARFDAAKPAAVMAAHGHYADTVALFAAGATDAVYSENARVMSALAAKHGIRVTRYLSPGSGHDWTTASNAFRRGFDLLYPRLGLSKGAQNL
ncbi:alpha/beta hydrolase [Frondihabitans australicus]|uniref:S-formylglutathione hydrolase FrmB n=1 Tax=Frondihabitans australicus TaxID=386892 RepID=A0A495IDI0_9MICO|nr:alpha/beta hydrolase-fold protein [Frondihabitans australicus]RKR73909.1 S-formylglutathione hydrolase FrmB [Frondihabitans australicus]